MTSHEVAEGTLPGASALGEFLYPMPAERRAVPIIRWWESRRVHFNLVLGGSGAVSLGVIALFQSLPPFAESFAFPLFGIGMYTLLANFCYSLGPATEILLEKMGRGRLLPTGPLLFRAGLTFTIGLTLVLPAILMTMEYVFRILNWIS